MRHPFDALAGEYTALLASCQITRRLEAIVAAKRILKLKPRYQAVSAKTGVPILWLMAINERESSSNMYTYLGNGQSLFRVTTEVPRGRGPFGTWEEGAEDALHLDQIDQVRDWSWPRALYEDELWNGFGYRAYGRHSPYLWGGTNIQQPGKYVADGVWNPNAWDPQLGTVALMKTIVSLDASLDLAGGVPVVPDQPIPDPAPVPQGHDGGEHGVSWLQDALNKIENAELVVDGSYGRLTARAVRTFQAAHGLAVDGIAGPLTIAAVEKALS
jgi:lysozyme family protein